MTASMRLIAPAAVLAGVVTTPIQAQAPYLVKDIRPAAGADSSPAELTEVDETLFFMADDGVHGAELWRSDGTEAGTVLVKDIRPGPETSVPPGGSWLASMGGRIFFNADDGVHGPELWRSDGAEAGTVLVKEITPGTGGFGPGAIRSVGGAVYFTANDSLGLDAWRSDGTPEGTYKILDLDPSQVGGYPREFVGLGGHVYFTADFALWRTDGTAAGTVMVKEIRPAGKGLGPAQLTPLNGILLFTADLEGEGRELWRSDGTSAGTFLLRSFNPSDLGAEFGEFLAVEGVALFRVYDTLWRSDGTAAGTVPVHTFPSFSGPTDLTNVAGALYFVAAEASPAGRELWRSDGTAAGTAMVTEIDPAVGPGPASLTAWRGQVYFSASDGSSGLELWRSDGTASGTRRLADLAPGPLDSNPSALAVAGSRLFFAADDGQHGNELWAMPPETGAARFYSLPPCRMVDTRGGTALSAGSTRTFALAGSPCGVPADARAVSANLTAVNPGSTGFLSVFRAGALPPHASSVNFVAGVTRANSVIAPVGLGGLVSVRCEMVPGGVASTHFLMDVVGYFKE